MTLNERISRGFRLTQLDPINVPARFVYVDVRPPGAGRSASSRSAGPSQLSRREPVVRRPPRDC